MEGTRATANPPARLGTWTEQVRRFLLARMGDPALAQDLAQEAATRLLRELERGREIQAPRAWMFRTARNLAVDEVRRRQPQPLGLEWQARLVDPATVGGEEASWVLDGEPVAASELLARLDGALRALPQRDRSVLRRYYLDGGSCESLAREDAISVHALRVRLYRARGRLRTLLETRAGR